MGDDERQCLSEGRAEFLADLRSTPTHPRWPLRSAPAPRRPRPSENIPLDTKSLGKFERKPLNLLYRVG